VIMDPLSLTLIHSWGESMHDLVTSLFKVPPPNTIKLGIKFPTYKLWRTLSNHSKLKPRGLNTLNQPWK
jgi:hypothetical protein